MRDRKIRPGNHLHRRFFVSTATEQQSSPHPHLYTTFYESVFQGAKFKLLPRCRRLPSVYSQQHMTAEWQIWHIMMITHCSATSSPIWSESRGTWGSSAAPPFHTVKVEFFLFNFFCCTPKWVIWLNQLNMLEITLENAGKKMLTYY